MQLTVLGSAGTHPAAGRACSGYLVEAGGTRVVVDAGNGSTANLQLLRDLREVDAFVITHRHLDHCIDLVSAYYALLDTVDDHPPVPVYAAPEVVDFLTSLLSRDSTLDFHRVYDCHTVEAGQELELGGIEFAFSDSVHPVPTLTSRIRHDGRLLVYSSDSAGGSQLVEAAAGAHAFLCEATWDDLEGRPEGIHLDGGEAGRIAREAGAQRLLLTHVAGGSDRGRIQQDALEAFGTDDVHQVEDLLTYDV